MINPNQHRNKPKNTPQNFFPWRPVISLVTSNFSLVTKVISLVTSNATSKVELVVLCRGLVVVLVVEACCSSTCCVLLPAYCLLLPALPSPYLLQRACATTWYYLLLPDLLLAYLLRIRLLLPTTSTYCDYPLSTSQMLRFTGF